MTRVAMTPGPFAEAPTTGRRNAMLRAAAIAVVTLWSAHWLPAKAVNAVAPAGKKAASKNSAEEGVRWAELKPAQQSVLKPLERDWSGIDAPRKQKWLELSARFPRMSPDEQTRVQARMADWAKMTPQERGQARMNYQEAKQLPAQDRQARWESYQALPPEQKRRLAERAGPSSAPPTPPPALAQTPQAKSNIVPNPAFAVPPQQVAPTVTRAGPGATTTLMSKRPAPPSHQQAGLPKIAATPEFVNKATLQPKRGPQAAATRSAKASETDPSQRQ